MRNVVDHLIARGFKSPGRLAKAAERAPSAPWGWRQSNSIPSPVQQNLLRNAERFGVSLTPLDFFPEYAADHLPKSPTADPRADKPPYADDPTG